MGDPSHVETAYRRHLSAWTEQEGSYVTPDCHAWAIAALSNGYFRQRWIRCKVSFIALLSLAFFYALWELPAWQSSGVLPKSEFLPTLEPWQLLVSGGVWLSIFAFFVLCSTLAIRGRHRLLLVVDDLDRCDTRQMLEIIESIKLLVEEEELDDRMQVIVLVEESRLDQAVSEKLCPMHPDHESEVSGIKLRSRILVHEHLDKLFLAYYRFPELSPDELAEAATTFIAAQLLEIREQLKQRLETAAAADRDSLVKQLVRYDEALDSGKPAPDSGQPEGGNAPPQAGTTGQTVVEKIPGLFYSRPEMSVLASAMGKLPSRFDRAGYSWGPRAVRLFIYRYQFVRLLLETSEQETEWPPDQIVEAMMLAYEDRVQERSVEWGDVHAQLKSIVKSVI
jgi:hypothetical protein